MKNQYVKDLQAGQSIDDYFAVGDKSAPREYQNGFMFSFDVSDKTGRIAVKFWGKTVHDVFSSFQENDVVSIKGGQASRYRERLEIHLNEGSCEIKTEENFEIGELAATTVKSIPEMISRFKEEIESITDDSIRLLLKSIFSEDLMKKYSESPAARTNHHNYVDRGGRSARRPSGRAAGARS